MPYFEGNYGTRLFYLDGGTGQPIVLAASAWLNSTMWENQIPFLVEQGYRCLAPDRRGHGRSDVSWEGYDYDTLADDLAVLIDTLDLRDVVLVGHSAGAGEVVRYLARHGSARVAALALVSGTTPFPMQTADNPYAIERRLMEADLAVRTRDRARWFRANAGSFFGVGLPGIEVSPEYTDFMIGQCLSCSPRATREFFVTGFTSDLRADLRAVTVPTLIVHGDHDAQAPIDLCGRRAAGLVPDSQFRVYEGAAHGLFATHAARLNEDLLALARVPVRRSS